MTGRGWPLLVVVVGTVPTLALGWSIWAGADGMLTWGGHMPVVRDYIWLWGAGTLLASGQGATVFDPAAFAAFIRGALGGTLDDFAWSYPPPMLFLALPAASVPLLVGFAVYALAQGALLWGVGRLAGLGTAAWVVLASPAALENFVAGQNGGLVGALLVGGLMLAGRRPFLAGALLGMLVLKPQAGLLVPVCLLASRDVRTAAAASATAASLVLASVIVFGGQSWADFWTQTRPYMTGILQADWHGLFYQRIMVTAFMAARSSGAGLEAGAFVQAAVAAGAALTCWRLWRLPSHEPGARMAATVCLTLLATPYGYTYDMTAIGIAVAALLSERRISTVEGAALGLAWLWPGCALAASLAGFPNAGALAIAGVAWVGVRRALPSRPQWPAVAMGA